MALEIESRIRALAHQFWEEEGRPEGMEQEHWRRAQQRLQAEESASSRGGRHSARGRDGDGAPTGDGMGGDPDGSQSGQTKEQVFLRGATRLTPD